MSKTPSKSIPNVTCFSPKEQASPYKDSPGISRTVFTHVSRLQGLMNDWSRVCVKGTKLCKAISALKIHEYHEGYYPQALKPLTEGLTGAVDSLKDIVDGVQIVHKQLQALGKLQPTGQPVIFTWSAMQISNQVQKTLSSLIEEYRLKQTAAENIAHCRDENLIEVYVSSWEFDVFVDSTSNAYLFAEVGLSGIT